MSPQLRSMIDKALAADAQEDARRIAEMNQLREQNAAIASQNVTLTHDNNVLTDALAKMTASRNEYIAAWDASRAESEAEIARLNAQRFTPWPDTSTYFGCISNTADGDAEKAMAGELCLGHNISNKKADERGNLIYDANGLTVPLHADPSPLIVRWTNERESAKRTGRFRCRSGSLMTVYRAGAVPLQIPGEGWNVAMTKPPVVQYPHEPRDFPHVDDLPLLVVRSEQVMAGEEFFFWDNAGGHERHGFCYTFAQSIAHIAATSAAGSRVGCRCVYNIVYHPYPGTEYEWEQLADAVTSDHAIMIGEVVPPNADTVAFTKYMLGRGVAVVWTGDPMAGSALIKANFHAGDRVYQCRSPFQSDAAYLSNFSR